MDSKEMALYAAQVLDTKKAMNIALINVGIKAAFADYFVLASGGNERQIETLVDEVADQFEKEHINVKHIEGKKTSGWILMDYGDIIVNIMTDEMRDKFNIEKLWGDCEIEIYESK